MFANVVSMLMMSPTLCAAAGENTIATTAAVANFFLIIKVPSLLAGQQIIWTQNLPVSSLRKATSAIRKGDGWPEPFVPKSLSQIWLCGDPISLLSFGGVAASVLGKNRIRFLHRCIQFREGLFSLL